MTVELAQHRARLRQEVNRLTSPTTQPIVRDDGTTTYATIPSLWAQACDALTGGMESSVRVSNPFERAPVDLGLVAARTLISGTTQRALRHRRLTLADSVPRQLRDLAAHIDTYEPDRLWFHADRFAEWARLLTGHLNAGEHTAAPVRLRDSPCPICRTRQVVLDGPDGPVVVPAIVVDFHQGYVRAAHCLACAGTWFRGVQLEELAVLLGCPIPA